MVQKLLVCALFCSAGALKLFTDKKPKVLALKQGERVSAENMAMAQNLVKKIAIAQNYMLTGQEADQDPDILKLRQTKVSLTVEDHISAIQQAWSEKPWLEAAYQETLANMSKTKFNFFAVRKDDPLKSTGLTNGVVGGPNGPLTVDKYLPQCTYPYAGFPNTLCATTAAGVKGPKMSCAGIDALCRIQAQSNPMIVPSTFPATAYCGNTIMDWREPLWCKQVKSDPPNVLKGAPPNVLKAALVKEACCYGDGKGKCVEKRKKAGYSHDCQYDHSKTCPKKGRRPSEKAEAKFRKGMEQMSKKQMDWLQKLLINPTTPKPKSPRSVRKCGR